MPLPPDGTTHCDIEPLANFGFEWPGRGWVHAKKHEVIREVPIEVARHLQQAGRVFAFACGADKKPAASRSKAKASA